MLQVIKFTFLIFCFIINFGFKTDSHSKKHLPAIRSGFYDAVMDSRKVNPLAQKIIALNSQLPLIKVYEGATYALMAKSKWNPFAAVKLLKLAHQKINEAAQSDASNLEIRFIRFAVQKNLPSFLGYSENTAEDKKYIINHLNLFNTSLLEENMRSYLFTFLIDQGGYNKSEKELITAKFDI